MERNRTERREEKEEGRRTVFHGDEEKTIVMLSGRMLVGGERDSSWGVEG